MPPRSEAGALPVAPPMGRAAPVVATLRILQELEFPEVLAAQRRWPQLMRRWLCCGGHASREAPLWGQQLRPQGGQRQLLAGLRRSGCAVRGHGGRLAVVEQV